MSEGGFGRPAATIRLFRSRYTYCSANHPAETLAVRGECPASHIDAAPGQYQARRGRIPAVSTPLNKSPAPALAGCSAVRMQWDFHHGLLVSRLTDTWTKPRSAAPGWQGATREQIGAFVTEEQRSQTGCPARGLFRYL